MLSRLLVGFCFVNGVLAVIRHDWGEMSAWSVATIGWLMRASAERQAGWTWGGFLK